MTSADSILISNGSVLARCGEVLLAKGYRIRPVVTGDATAHSWAIKVGIPSHELDEAVKVASQLGCEICFQYR
jgi:hypothetical protein